MAIGQLVDEREERHGRRPGNAEPQRVRSFEVPQTAIRSLKPFSAAGNPAMGRAPSPRSSLGFGLLLLTNLILFVRPGDLIPSLTSWPIYEVVIIACLAVSAPELMRELSARSLRRLPVSLCVVGFLPVVALSDIFSHLGLQEAAMDCIIILKMVVYFLLLLIHLNSVARLRTFLATLLVFTVGIAMLALLQYRGYINLPTLTQMYQGQDQFDEESGTQITLARLCSVGIFGNPNDLSRILVIGMLICLFCVGEKRYGRLRFLSAPALVVLGYANTLTYSRGGFLGLLAGLGVLFWARYGGRKAIVLACFAVPVLLAVSAGRQTEISTETETAHARIQLWRDGLQAMKSSPLFGSGMDTYAEVSGDGLVAHNSFVHAFVELGLVGGTLFVGFFFFTIPPLFRSRRYDRLMDDPELVRVRACVLAILISYAVGLISSSRCYEVPTYLFVGLTAVCCRLLAARVPEAIRPFDIGSLGRLVRASLLVLVGHYVFVRLSN